MCSTSQRLSATFFQAKQPFATKLQMCPNLFPVSALSNNFLQTAELRIVKRNLEKPGYHFPQIQVEAFI